MTPLAAVAYGAAFLLILASRLHVIAYCASLVPFWDEWDAVFARMLLPLAHDNLTAADMLSANNEHRVTITRVFDLGLAFAQHGQWRILTELVCMQAIFTAGAVWLLRALSRGLDVRRQLILLAAGTTLFAIPFDWEAQVWAFISQMYFCVLLAIAALVLVGRNGPGRPAFWVGIGAAVAGTLCFAASITALLASSAVVAVRDAAGPHRRAAWLALCVLLGAVVVLVATTPAAPVNAGLAAHSLPAFLRSTLIEFAWPLPWPCAPVVWAPALAYLALRWPGRAAALRDPLYWTIAGFACWSCLVAAEIGYARATAPTLSRYAVFLGIGLILNIACAVRLKTEVRSRVAIGAAFAWALLIAAGSLSAAESIRRESAYRRYLADLQTTNVAGFLRTDNLAFLQKGGFAIPYPSGSMLADFLRQGVAAHILPDDLRTADTHSGQAWRKSLAKAGNALALAGVLLALLAGRAATMVKNRTAAPYSSPTR